MSRKMFGDAARAHKSAEIPEGSEPIEVDIQGKINGETVTKTITVSVPGDGQQTILMVMVSRGTHLTMSDAGRFINTFLSMIDPEGRELVEELLLNSNGTFGLSDLTEIFEHCLEEWSSRPTGRPRTSSGSRSKTGSTSTGATRRAASTRSISPSVASLT